MNTNTTRRSFLGMLASLPIVGALVPIAAKRSATGDCDPPMDLHRAPLVYEAGDSVYVHNLDGTICSLQFKGNYTKDGLHDGLYVRELGRSCQPFPELPAQERRGD